MLLYKNHRFHCQGVSFAIPDGYSLDTSYEEVPEDTLHLWSEDEMLYVRVGIERGTRGPLKEINYVLQELDECIVDAKPSAVLLGGLCGFATTYTVGQKQYQETRLLIEGEEDDQVELLLLIIAKGGLPEADLLHNLISSIDPKRDCVD